MKQTLIFVLALIFLSACAFRPIHHNTRYDMSNQKVTPYQASPVKRY